MIVHLLGVPDIKRLVVCRGWVKRLAGTPAFVGVGSPSLGLDLSDTSDEGTSPLRDGGFTLIERKDFR